MHQAGKLLREEVLRDTLNVPQSCAPGVLQLKLCPPKPLSSVDRSWLLGSKYKLQGSQSAYQGWANTRKEGAEAIFSGTDVSIQLFYLPGVFKRWFQGQGRSICGYLNTGPIHLWSDTSWGPLVCCGLSGALGCSAPVLHDDLNLVSPAKT